MANILLNPGFTGGLTSWKQTPAGVAVYGSNNVVFTGTGSATVQFYQNDLNIVSGTSYTFSVKARAGVAGAQLRVQLVDHDDPNTNLGLDATYTVGTTDAVYTTTFSATASRTNARLRFRLTNTTNSFTLDDASLDNAAGGGGGDLVVDFSADVTSGTAPLYVVFHDLTEDTDGWTWAYNSGSGWTTFSTGDPFPEFEFTTPGVYSIRLTAEAGADTGTVTKTDFITVLGGISANFTGTPLSGTAPVTVAFTDFSTSTSGITGRSWEYNRNGEGWVEFSTVTNPSYNFTIAGVYSIRLTVTGPDGSDTFEQPSYITILGTGVVANFTGTPLGGDIPFDVTFTDTSTGTITDHIWEYSRNGGPWTEFSTADDPTLSITQAGSYSIRLSVNGPTDDDQRTRLNYVVATGEDTIMATFYNEFGSGETIQAAYTFDPEVDYHIIASYDYATGEGVLYIDGEEVARASLSSFLLGGTASDTVYVGNFYGVSNLDGIIDEVFFLNRAINPDEVRAVYESDAPVFAETSTWHWRAGRNRVYSDAEGFWMVNASGGKVIGAYAGDENDPAAFKTWGGINLYESDVLIGDANRGNYFRWDDDQGTLEVAGIINIIDGAGWANLTDRPTQLSDINSTESAKLGSVEWNATIGAVWGVNLTSLPDWADGRLDDVVNETGVIVRPVIPTTAVTPSGSGLLLQSTHMGYYGPGGWKTYMDNAGNFYYKGTTGFLQWNAALDRLQGVGPGNIEQFYLDANDGRFKAAAGGFVITRDGPHLITDSTYTPTAQDESKAITFVRSTGEIAGRLIGAYQSGLYGVSLYGISPDAEPVTLRLGAVPLGVIYAGGSPGFAQVVLTTTAAAEGFVDVYANNQTRFFLNASSSADIIFDDDYGVIVAGPTLDSSLGYSNVRLGNNGTPRVWLDNGSSLWGVDNEAGVMRFFVPGSVKATLTTGGVFSVGVTSTRAYQGNSFVLLDGQVIALSTYTAVTNGMLIVNLLSNATVGLFNLRGGINAVAEMSDVYSQFSTAKNTSAQTNIYNESGVYYMQNNTGGTLSYMVSGFGQ